MASTCFVLLFELVGTLNLLDGGYENVPDLKGH